MTERSANITGGCLCGAIRYVAAGEPLWLAHGHCASCRRATGAPLVTYAGFPAERLAYQSDEPVRSDSSPGVKRSFCGRYGTPLTYEANSGQAKMHVMVCTFDRPDAVTPKHHVLIEEKLPWLHLATVDDDA